MSNCNLPREELERMYVVEKLSSTVIAEHFSCHPDTVRAWLRRHSIRVRSSSEAVTLASTGRVSPNKGVKWTPEHHELHKQLWADPEYRAKVIPKRSGANSHLWRGGVSHPSNLKLARTDWRQTAKACYIRDDGRCRDCGVKCLSRKEARKNHEFWRIIAAHHLVPRRDGGSDELSNLVTLCARCHGTREQAEMVAA